MAKRNNDHINMSDALKEFVSTNKLQKGIDQIDVKTAWNAMMGQAIESYTTNIQLKNDVLYISLSSSVLRDELSYGKDKIIKMLNEELGKALINKVVLR
jgi:hypothetical protein